MSLFALTLLWSSAGFAQQPTSDSSLAQTETPGGPVDKDTEPSASEPVSSPEDDSFSTFDPDSETFSPDEDLADGELYSDVEEIQIQGQRGAFTEVDSTDSSVMFGSEDLQAMGIDDISDLAKVTPNLEIRTAGATSANFFIRGVGLADFSANAPSAVAIYQDGVALNAPALQRAQIFDVGNVNVIRGPLGSGRGRNASAGAIKLEARKPGKDFGANMLTRLFWYESPDVEVASAMGQEYEGGVDIPLAGDWLFSRFSFLFREADPYKLNGCADTNVYFDDGWKVCGINGPGAAAHIRPGLPAFVGDKGNWGVRGQFNLLPSSGEMEWLLNVHGGRLAQDSTLGQAIGSGNNNGQEIGGPVADYQEPDQGQERLEIMSTYGLDNAEAFKVLGPILLEERPLDTRPYRGDYNRIGQTTLDTWGASLTGDFFFDSFELNTVTGYEGYDRFRDIDQDFTPLVIFESITTDSAWQFSEDIQISGELFDDTFEWSAGGWFLMEKMEFDQTQYTALSVAGENAAFVRTWSQDTYGFSVWGEFDWTFLDDFSLKGGLRYNWEEKTFDYVRTLAASLNPDANRGERPGPRTASWASPTGILELTYRFTDMVAAYWKFTHGFKSGYFNANEYDEPPIEAEKINAVEVGFRGSWFDGIFDMSADFFYYAYDDYQVFVFTDEVGQGPTLQILNAPKAQVYGSEMSITLTPLQDLLPEEYSGLRLQAQLGWLSSEFLEFTQEVNVVDQNGRPFTKVVNYAGNRLPNSPDFTVAATAEWEVDLGSWGAVVPRYDVQWTTDIFFDPTDGRGASDYYGDPYNPEYTVGQPGYALHNLQILYRLPNGMAEARIWGRNITDVRYKDYAFDATVFRNVIVNFVGEPRTVGFDLSFTF
ncbi:MAG: TonB-dependent receptor [Myxococcota bacterium]|nr:TonB-dependent receptor [Myxococcota bacterium]